MQHQAQMAAPRESPCKHAVLRPHCWRVWAPGGNGRGDGDSTARNPPGPSPPQAQSTLGASSRHQPGLLEVRPEDMLRECGTSGGGSSGVADLPHSRCTPVLV